MTAEMPLEEQLELLMMMRAAIDVSPEAEPRYVPQPAWVAIRQQQLNDLRAVDPARYGHGFAQYWDEHRLTQEWERRCGPRAAEIRAAELVADEQRLAFLMGELGNA